MDDPPEGKLRHSTLPRLPPPPPTSSRRTSRDNQRDRHFPRRSHRATTAKTNECLCLQSRVNMDRPKTTTGHSARWGAACAPCAAAKTRCIRSQPQSSRSQPCDRCRSLEKDCVGQAPGPRKKRQAKLSYVVHVHALLCFVLCSLRINTLRATHHHPLLACLLAC